jgi:hypothetical protein
LGRSEDIQEDSEGAAVWAFGALDDWFSANAAGSTRSEKRAERSNLMTGGLGLKLALTGRAAIGNQVIVPDGKNGPAI